MTGVRWRDFFDTLASVGVYPTDRDYNAAFTFALCKQKVGMKP